MIELDHVYRQKDKEFIDLLNKIKSFEVQKTGENTSADIELSINPWTTKLHNLQNPNQIKAK